MDSGFTAAGWSNGLLPAGYSFSGLATDLTSQMKGKTPSLYLRKEFQAAADLAGSTNTLILSVQFNDGFVAYLNGREVARMNCGPTNHFVFVSEPAANVNTNTGVIEVALGSTQNWLRTGRNVLALQAHNAEQPSTTNDPGRITAHQPTPEFRINAGLKIAPADTNGLPAELIPLGTAAGQWRYFVGRAEPSGGVVDFGILTRTFVPPTGEEDDFDTPSAFSDWVELYNNGAASVNLGGWCLSDDAANPFKWRFPTNTIIAPQGFLVVLCDNRDEANAPAGPATYLHTNFRLNEDGGFVGLFDGSGQWMDGLLPEYPGQVVSCSYGRAPEDPLQLGYLSTATPGTTNTGAVYLGRASPVEFQDSLGTNLPGGFYAAASLNLYLRPQVPDQTVRYTLDGSDPTDWNGFTYTNPLVITQPSDKKGVVVRARAVAPGLVPSKIRTHTYILRQPTLLTNAPVLCLTADGGRNFFKPDGLMAISGGQYPTNGNIIWLANGPQSYNWAIGDGSPFEREVHLEYYYPASYYPTNQTPIRTDIGLRLSASSYSRPRLKLTNPAGSSPWPSSFTEKPSFNLFFDGEFGPGKLDYELFTNYNTREFEQLRLRAGKNDISNPFITDELMRRLFLDLGQVGSRGLFCSLYVNGTYRGIFNLCERFREKFFQAHYRSELPWDVNYISTWVSGDSTAFNQMLSALDRDLSVSTYWQSVTNLIDLDNTADYFLLNIYGATWDWPGNNYVVARERSTGPNRRWRFGMWDAEGAFAAIATSRSTSYNTITNDLIVPPGHNNYNVNLPRIFRRLSTSLEFRLLFADHIQSRMFNGGVLDDRDPDGVGPLKSRFQQRLDELVKEAGELVRYSSGQALKQTPFMNWITTTNSRRSFLLGNTPGRQMFRDSGFWPLTEPPAFNQHGGSVPPGFSLSMTSNVASQTASIYFTLNGSDPRNFGGALNPAAQLYVSPIILTQVVTVMARARNNATAEWSPATVAAFAPAAVPASATNLVVAEIMYHPPDATATEVAAGYDNADDFEFLRLLNIGTTPIDLAGVRLTLGVTFDLTTSPLRYLNSGSNVLMVANRAAFQTRYGRGCDALIAGEYAGRLANSGETLRVVDSRGVIIRDFSYWDIWPWPMAADGDGPSLVLADPSSNPNHDDPASWAISAVPGGLPGGAAAGQTFAAWRALYWDVLNATNNLVSGPAADPDGDGFNNFVEYAFGSNPLWFSPQPEVEASCREFAEDTFLVLSLRLSPGAQDAVLSWEKSADLLNWTSVGTSLSLIRNDRTPNGTVLQEFKDSTPVSSRAASYFRLRIASP